jgi:4-hydroxy-3-methylbut-2-en-1-yl diphosphate synthase IspG/GcpE
MYLSEPMPRKQTMSVQVGNVMIGGTHPIVVQSMTNTDTADSDSTVAQVAALAKAGSEIVRITVDKDEAAAAVARIRDRLDNIGCHAPLVAIFTILVIHCSKTTQIAQKHWQNTVLIQAMLALKIKKTSNLPIL